MSDKEALEAFGRGERLDQAIVKRLWQSGYVEVREATNMQSTQREYIPLLITERGKRLLEGH